jgi:flagellar basal body-associated protein FliL
MTKPTKRKKRGKLSITLLLPALAFVFIVGWILAWTGQLKQPKTKQQPKQITK